MFTCDKQIMVMSEVFFIFHVSDTSPAEPVAQFASTSRATESETSVTSQPIYDTSNWVVPQELLCPLCQNIMKSAVITPCCSACSCEACISHELLRSDDEQCPFCGENGVTPDNLIPNR